MRYEFNADRATQPGGRLEQLAQAEARLAQARRNNDRDLRRQAQNDVSNTVRRLLQESMPEDAHSAHAWAAAHGYESSANEIKSRWQAEFPPAIVGQQLFDGFAFLPDRDDAGLLPPYSVLLRVDFVLAKPYLSKDDVDFYLLDNPVRKDKIFKLPMVAPTGWKGALRAALRQLGLDDGDSQFVRLFGIARDNDAGAAGCLYFYPTFFTQPDALALEVINPHNRLTGIGERGPISMECVRAGARGQFWLAYVPLRPANLAFLPDDLRLLAAAVTAMLATYGFGAKTSSGYGIVHPIRSRAELAVNARLPQIVQGQIGSPVHPAYYPRVRLRGLVDLADLVAGWISTRGDV